MPETPTATITSDVTRPKNGLYLSNCRRWRSFLLLRYGSRHRANKTNKPRAGLAIHFLHTDYAKPSLVEENRTTRPYLAGPEATGGLKEYGVKLEGAWGQEIAHILAEAQAAAN